MAALAMRQAQPGFDAAGYSRAEGGDTHVWGAASFSELEFDANESTYDTELETVRVGFEERLDDLQYGVAISYTTGESKFDESGQADFEQVGITPYIARSWDSKQLWALVSVGSGTLDYMYGQGAGRREASSSTESNIFAAGFEYHTPGLGGNVDVTARAEGMIFRIESREHGVVRRNKRLGARRSRRDRGRHAHTLK